LRSTTPRRRAAAIIDALVDSPVVLEVGKWVLQTACKTAAGWQAKGLPPLRIGVNLFPAQFHGGRLLEDIDAALQSSGLAPQSLEIEITENIALAQDEASLEPLRKLRAAGVHLAFDDFGTGYASLSYLARFPLSRIKIDQSFVRKIGDQNSRQDTAIIRSIIVMAHNLGLEVIAEGVETEAQAAFLESERCEEAQGFLYARPLPAADFEEFVRAKASSRPAVAPARTAGAR
jgi:EAL domain-containing protein (putative c-di-GMP-specific phosphodiesterase class I)